MLLRLPNIFFLALAGLLSFFLFWLPFSAEAGSRVKDIVDIEGVRDNPLTGYGLVVGLPGSGDSLRNAPFTRQSLEAMLDRMGISTGSANLNTNTVAAVMVTANLPAFAANGSRLDANVSALGNAKSLSGGTLLVTPLRGADGNTYAIAHGPVAIGGFSASGESGSSVTKNIPTNGRIPNGAMVERELPSVFSSRRILKLSLRNPDFTTAQRLAEVINDWLGSEAARVRDSGNVYLMRPPDYEGNMASLLADIERLSVEPDQPARIVINERTGVVVMDENVRVSTVAIAQGNLTIQITELPGVSQPLPQSETGETTAFANTRLDVSEGQGGLAILQGGTPLRSLVTGLNTLGVTPRDMISILQALKAAGALHASIEVM